MQALLDRHGAALAAGARRVPQVRAEIRAALDAAAATRTAALSAHDARVERRRALAARLATPESAQRETRIAALTRDADELAAQIVALQARHAALLETRAQLAAQRDRDERKYKDALAALDTQIAAFTAADAARAERDAARDAAKLWRDVEAVLARLDAQINTLPSAAVPDVRALVDTGLQQLAALHAAAAELGVSFLEIAVAHELQLLERVAAALR